MFINHTSKEVTAKIVYYGPGLSGKTTNLQYIFSVTNPLTRGELVSIETDIERTLFFDLLPINIGLIKGYQAKFQLYTVPGQIFYNSTRKLVLKGVDGIVFVSDSQQPMEGANIESMENLESNLQEQKQDLNKIPMVFQFNKRDLKNLIPVDHLNKILNPKKKSFFEAIATTGNGVLETLREISSLTLINIKRAIEMGEIKEAEKPAIEFDTNKEQEIIKKEELPYKKISVDNIPNFGDHNIELELEKEDQTEKEKPSPTKTLVKEIKKNFIDNLSDNSRLTVIKQIKVNESPLNVEIKDNESKILESFNLDIDPETKKITIILDVKK
jgi:signal recognition particle receptor subunit beta